MTIQLSSLQNNSFCTQCEAIVPTRHINRDDKVYLLKECKKCGESETLISTNAKRYYEKRTMLGYEGEALKSCDLECYNCTIHKPPTLVFLDVTNRCNMNCPICLANIPAMGFRFDPPIDYFKKVFEAISKIETNPAVQLFGGEPTVREDLIDIIKLAKRDYNVSTRVVTNGLRLADEEYAKKLLATGTQLMFSFDGRNPKIYEHTRNHSKALELKLKALENISKYSKSKIVTMMTCVSEGLNDAYLADLVDFCHEGRNYIVALNLMPLTATWGPEEVDAQGATIEDVERVMKKAIPGLEFFPSGVLYKLNTLQSTFDLGSMTFGGAHPNCETISAMISDGQKYHPVSKFLKQPTNNAVTEWLELDRLMGEKLKRSTIAKRFGPKGRKFVYGMALLKFQKKHVNYQEVFGGGTTLKVAQIIWGLLTGVKFKQLLRKYTRCHSILRLIIMPFEEKACVEAARLVDCPANFAYEHPETREIRLMPVCSWVAYKNNILRSTAANYQDDYIVGDVELTALNLKPNCHKTLLREKSGIDGNS